MYRAIDFGTSLFKASNWGASREPADSLGTTELLAGIGLGIGLMYFFHPREGRRHRARLSDQLGGVVRRGGGKLEVAGRDMSNRVQGMWAEAGSMFSNDEVVDDRKLTDRVRSKIGRVVSHPGAIHVIIRDGFVTLFGPILEAEVDGLLSVVAGVSGVRGVENQLEIHEQAGNTPGLQGGRPRPGMQRPDVLQDNWSPATRLIAGALGSAMMLNCAARRTPGAVLLGTLGFGMFVRSVTNKSLEELADTMQSSCALNPGSGGGSIRQVLRKPEQWTQATH